MVISDLVLREGDGLRASGRVVADGETVWFEPPLPVPLLWRSPGSEPAPRPSEFGVPVLGVDLANLDDRRATSGGVEGWVTLTGTWRRDRLLVERQEPGGGRTDRSAPQWRRPPCPPPQGGWPKGETNDNIRVATDVLATLTITSLAVFRPSAHQAVLVVATDEPEHAEAVLRPICGDRLCIVRSRWTKEQLNDASERLRAEMRAWMIYGSGQSVSQDGQAVLTVKLTHVLPSFAQWADTLAEGLLSVTPWLVPQRTSQSLAATCLDVDRPPPPY
ncbi:hypothetical protein [Rugosimonospora africana]|uniref:Uncharacterized protein n=1 Tax=Rugosimonospora africana TaxID=556532 RepID=A0A8J3QTC6_9ACTN|nr:hypothetical protein [Rugosimonospora africana]GIH16111.1 hypothetical protein Raf01_42830 [Rugosimonospora africana]